MWYVYIIQCADDSLYTGIAKDVEARIAQHNSGTGAKYTRGRLPVSLLYSESTDSRSEALQREMQIKKLDRQGKLRLIGSASQ